MTKLLEQAFTEASRLPDEEQEALAAWILTEIAAERRWQQAFDQSRELLDVLADEALGEFQQGRTTALDPENL